MDLFYLMQGPKDDSEYETFKPNRNKEKSMQRKVHEMESTFPCHGRDKNARPVLKVPVNAIRSIRVVDGEETISTEIKDCPHAVRSGGHGGSKCTVSADANVMCPHAIDLPYALDYYKTMASGFYD